MQACRTWSQNSGWAYGKDSTTFSAFLHNVVNQEEHCSASENKFYSKLKGSTVIKVLQYHFFP